MKTFCTSMAWAVVLVCAQAGTTAPALAQISARVDVAALRAAAADGQPSAMLQLGFAYENGKSVPRDHAQAAVWYRKAIDLDYGPAMFYLGLLYWSGRGVHQDYVEAYKWFDLALSRASGSEVDRDRQTRDSLAKVMSPKMIALAEQRVRDWQSAFDKKRKSGL